MAGSTAEEKVGAGRRGFRGDGFGVVFEGGFVFFIYEQLVGRLVGFHGGGQEEMLSLASPWMSKMGGFPREIIEIPSRVNNAL